MAQSCDAAFDAHALERTNSRLNQADEGIERTFGGVRLLLRASHAGQGLRIGQQKST